jgi:6-phosphofructokinase
VRLSQEDLSLRSKQLGHSQAQSITNTQQTLLASFATAGAATAFLKYSGDVMIQWLEGRLERSITFKHQSSRINLKGRKDIEDLIALLQRL